KYMLNRKGEQVLQHLEWPPSGTTLLRAVDDSNFYDTFCLVIEDRTVSVAVAPKHKENADSSQSAIVGEIQKKDKIPGDANSDIRDPIPGPNQDSSPAPATSEPSKLSPSGEASPPAQDKKSGGKDKSDKKKDDKMKDLEL